MRRPVSEDMITINPTMREWEDYLARLDFRDYKKERRRRRKEVSETDLSPKRTPKDKRVDLIALETRSKREPRQYPGGICYEDKNRHWFRRTVGMIGPWWAPDGSGYCDGCGNRKLPKDTYCAQCDRSGKDYLIGRPKGDEIGYIKAVPDKRKNKRARIKPKKDRRSQ